MCCQCFEVIGRKVEVGIADCDANILCGTGQCACLRRGDAGAGEELHIGVGRPTSERQRGVAVDVEVIQRYGRRVGTGAYGRPRSGREVHRRGGNGGGVEAVIKDGCGTRQGDGICLCRDRAHHDVAAIAGGQHDVTVARCRATRHNISRGQCAGCALRAVDSDAAICGGGAGDRQPIRFFYQDVARTSDGGIERADGGIECNAGCRHGRKQVGVYIIGSTVGVGDRTGCDKRYVAACNCARSNVVARTRGGEVGVAPGGHHIGGGDRPARVDSDPAICSGDAAKYDAVGFFDADVASAGIACVEAGHRGVECDTGCRCGGEQVGGDIVSGDVGVGDGTACSERHVVAAS